MEKKKDYLLVYLTLALVVGFFGWMQLKPQDVVYYGSIHSLEVVGDNYHFQFVAADSPYPERDHSFAGIKSGLVAEQGVDLQIRTAPDGTKQQRLDLVAMFQNLKPGDEIAFVYRDKAETILKTIIFTTPNK